MAAIPPPIPPISGVANVDEVMHEAFHGVDEDESPAVNCGRIEKRRKAAEDANALGLFDVEQYGAQIEYCADATNRVLVARGGVPLGGIAGNNAELQHAELLRQMNAIQQGFVDLRGDFQTLRQEVNRDFQTHRQEVNRDFQTHRDEVNRELRLLRGRVDVMTDTMERKEYNSNARRENADAIKEEDPIVPLRNANGVLPLDRYFPHTFGEHLQLTVAQVNQLLAHYNLPEDGVGRARLTRFLGYRIDQR